MNWYNVLEVSKDSDLKTIKRAYAKLLKIYNPEDDAEGYQRLREAYDEAVKYAKKNSKMQKTQGFNNDSDENIVNELNINKIPEDTNESYKDEEKQNNSKVNSYIDQINTDESNNEDNINKDKQNKLKINSYIDIINADKSNNEDNINIDKQNKSKVNSYIDYINYKDIKSENNNEKIKFKGNLLINNNFSGEQDTGINLDEQIQKFLIRLNEIYKDMSLRTDSKVWEDLLNSDVIWNVNAINIIEDELSKFLMKHKYLPAEIWTKLNYNFNWSKNEIKLYKKYSDSEVDEFLKNLKEPNKLKYDYIKSIDPDIADKYLYERLLAYEALKKQEYSNAYEHLNDSYSLFTRDAELLKLMAYYYYNAQNKVKTVELYKAAFEIDNSDFHSAKQLGIILSHDGNFKEAIPYLEVCLSLNPDDRSVLNNIAYCYYYENNVSMAKSSFEKLQNIDKKNKVIKKYLKNITAQLKGRKVRKINFNKNNLYISKEDKKEPQKAKKKLLSSKIKIGLIVCIAIIFVNGHNLFNYITNFNKNEVNTSKMSDTQKDYIEDDEIFKAINTKDDLRNIKYCVNIKIRLKNIEQLNYFKLSEKYNDKWIVSKEEIDNNNLQDKIESQLFMGNFQNKNIIFTMKDLDEENINQDDGYIVQGALSSLGFKEIRQIKVKYGTKNFYWSKNGYYIDSSQKEIDNVAKDSKLIEVHNDEYVRVSKTVDDFEEDNDFSGLQAIYLTNIIPSKVYAKIDDNGKINLDTKNKINENELQDYTQVFIGQLEGKNFMFIDKNFSMDDLDSDKGCTVYGYGYTFQDTSSPKKLPVEDGHNTGYVNVETKFLCNKDDFN